MPRNEKTRKVVASDLALQRAKLMSLSRRLIVDHDGIDGHVYAVLMWGAVISGVVGFILLSVGTKRCDAAWEAGGFEAVWESQSAIPTLLWSLIFLILMGVLLTMLFTIVRRRSELRSWFEDELATARRKRRFASQRQLEDYAMRHYAEILAEKDKLHEESDELCAHLKELGRPYLEMQGAQGQEVLNYYEEGSKMVAAATQWKAKRSPEQADLEKVDRKLRKTAKKVIGETEIAIKQRQIQEQAARGEYVKPPDATPPGFTDTVCQKCGSRLRFRDEQRGSKVRCPKCGSLTPRT